jgi:hypothetical protein
MEQLILHLFGDYVTQTDWMARYKIVSSRVALIHVTIYSLPFLLLSPSLLAFVVIFVSHWLIDRYRLPRFIIYAKNKLNDPGLQWVDASITGYPKDTPDWLAVWLFIIVDNTMHLMMNYAALRWL